jgi:hypothetical protein
MAAGLFYVCTDPGSALPTGTVPVFGLRNAIEA